MAGRNTLMFDGSKSDFTADRGALNLLSAKERKKVRIHAVHKAAVSWAREFIPRLFTNYARRARGYRQKGGKDRRPFHEDGDAERQVLRGTTVQVSGTGNGATAKVRMPFPLYITKNREWKRILETMPANEIRHIKETYERELQALINQDRRPSGKSGRQTILLSSRG